MVVAPLLWVVSPWYVVHHVSPALESERMQARVSEDALWQTEQSIVGYGKATPEGPSLIDDSPHCDSGACAVSVDTTSKYLVPRIPQRQGARDPGKASALVALLTKPPSTPIRNA